MKLIDDVKSYLVGSRPCPKGVPFDVDDEAGEQMLVSNKSCRRYVAPTDDRPAIELDEEPEAEQESPPELPADPEPEEPSEPKAAGIAVYKGHGWYEYEGENVRLKDIPEGVRIVKA